MFPAIKFSDADWICGGDVAPGVAASGARLCAGKAKNAPPWRFRPFAAL